MPSHNQRQEPAAVHLKHGDNHLVGLNALRVLLTPDGDAWFAQGLEIDYAASGATAEEVKTNFSEGLKLTVGEHLRIYGNIERLLKVAPQEAWSEFFSAAPEAIQAEYSALGLYQDEAADEAAVFPFPGIAFLARRVETAAT